MTTRKSIQSVSCTISGIIMLAVIILALGVGHYASAHDDTLKMYNSATDKVTDLCALNDTECQEKVKGTFGTEVQLPQTFVPGDWELLDELAFVIYVERVNSTESGPLDAHLKSSYKIADYFLKNMEKVRKPYVEGTK